jgi:hypothetical protein
MPKKKSQETPSNEIKAKDGTKITRKRVSKEPKYNPKEATKLELEEKILLARKKTPFIIPKDFFHIPVKNVLLFVDAKGEWVVNSWHNLGCYRKALSFPKKGEQRKAAWWNIQICAKFSLKEFEGEMITCTGNLTHRATTNGRNHWIIYINEAKDIRKQQRNCIVVDEELKEMVLDGSEMEGTEIEGTDEDAEKETACIPSDEGTSFEDLL